MSVTTTSGTCSAAVAEERGGIRGDADDLDVLVGVEQGADALAHEDVVLAQDDPDGGHAAYPFRAVAPCTIRA